MIGHVRTDPACAHHVAPKPGSRRDHRSRGRACRRCVGALEPWMFDVEVTVNGAPVTGQVVQFTKLAHIRMAWRALRGKPRILGVRDDG